MAYAGKTKLVLNRLKVVLDGVTGTQQTYKGPPESIATAVTASVSVGGRTPMDKATGYHETEVSFFIEFAYDVQNAEDTAEDTLADWVDGLEDAWLLDREATNATLGGLVRTWDLDFSPASDPIYRPVAGGEFRVLPVVARTVITRS